MSTESDKLAQQACARLRDLDRDLLADALRLAEQASKAAEGIKCATCEDGLVICNICDDCGERHCLDCDGHDEQTEHAPTIAATSPDEARRYSAILRTMACELGRSNEQRSALLHGCAALDALAMGGAP